jgi:hypothetical protein
MTAKRPLGGVRQGGVAPPVTVSWSGSLDPVWTAALAKVTGESRLPGPASTGQILGNLLTVQLAENGLNLALPFLPLDRQEGQFWVG